LRDILKILKKHAKWLRGEEGGERADLRGTDLRKADLRKADLRKADLREADLWWADLRRADLRWADLRGADLREADLRWADLRWADLWGANLKGADLRGANLDFSCFPLWCGSFGMIVDEKLVYQLLYHIARLDVRTEDAELKEFLASDTFKKLANKFHRVKECGEIS